MSEPLAFSVASKQKIAELVSRYPRKQAALIPTLYIAQNEFGYLKPEVMELVAAELQVPVATVLATSMFYSMLHKKPVGKYHVQICTNVSCYLRGCDDLVATAKQVLGIGFGETTDDGLFTLEQVQCLAACGSAPALQVNEKDHFDVTPQVLRDLLEQLRDDADPGQKTVSIDLRGGGHA